MMFYEIAIESYNLTLFIENYLKWIILIDKEVNENYFIFPNYIGIETKYSKSNSHK